MTHLLVPPPPVHAPPRPQGSALAVSALVIATVSLVLCWVPIVNNLFLGTALLAFVLGLLARRRARRGRSGGRGVATAAVIVSVVAAGGVLATQALYGAVLDEVGDELDRASAQLEDGLDGDSAQTEDDVAARATSALPLGEIATVGEYRVAVTAVESGPDVDRTIAAENQFNEPAGGRYVLVRVATVYDGAEEGDPWLDLDLELAGSDARIYDTSTCGAVVPNSVMDVPTLTDGGQATFHACFDLPAAALTEGAEISVAESFSLDDERTYWSVG